MMRTDKARAVQSSPRLEDPGDDGKSDDGDGGDESDEAETPRADAPPPRSPSKALGARGRTASELVAGLEEEEMLALLGERIELGKDAAEHLAGGGAAPPTPSPRLSANGRKGQLLERMEDLLQETAMYAVGDDQKAEKWKRPSLAAAHDARRAALWRDGGEHLAPSGVPRRPFESFFDRGNGGTSSPMLWLAALGAAFGAAALAGCATYSASYARRLGRPVSVPPLAEEHGAMVRRARQGRRTCGGRRGPEKISPSMAWTVRVPDPRPVREEDHRSDRERRRPKRHSGDGSYGAASAPAAEVTYLGKWVADVSLVRSNGELIRQYMAIRNLWSRVQISRASVRRWSEVHGPHPHTNRCRKALNQLEVLVEKMKEAQRELSRSVDRKGIDEVTGAFVDARARVVRVRCARDHAHSRYAFLRHSFQPLNLRLHRRAHFAARQKARRREQDRQGPLRSLRSRGGASPGRPPSPGDDVEAEGEAAPGYAKNLRAGTLFLSAVMLAGTSSLVRYKIRVMAEVVRPETSTCREAIAAHLGRYYDNDVRAGPRRPGPRPRGLRRARVRRRRVARRRDGGESAATATRRTRYSRNDLVECYCDREVRCKEQRLLHFERLMLRYAWTHAARKFLGRSKRLFHVVCREHMATHLGIKWIDRALVLVVVAVNSLFQVLFAAFAKVERHDSISTQLVNTAWKTFFLIFLNTAFLVPVFNMKRSSTSSSSRGADIEYRYSFALTYVLCALVYCSGLPVLVPLTAAYFWASYVADSRRLANTAVAPLLVAVAYLVVRAALRRVVLVYNLELLPVLPTAVAVPGLAAVPQRAAAAGVSHLTHGKLERLVLSGLDGGLKVVHNSLVAVADAGDRAAERRRSTLQRVHSARRGLKSDVLMRTWEIIVEEKRLASYDIMANPRYRLALEFLESVGTFRPKRELVKEIGVFREQVVQLKDRCNRENLERRLTTKVHEIRLEVVRRQEAVKNVTTALSEPAPARDTREEQAQTDLHLDAVFESHRSSMTAAEEAIEAAEHAERATRREADEAQARVLAAEAEAARALRDATEARADREAALDDRDALAARDAAARDAADAARYAGGARGGLARAPRWRRPTRGPAEAARAALDLAAHAVRDFGAAARAAEAAGAERRAAPRRSSDPLTLPRGAASALRLRDAADAAGAAERARAADAARAVADALSEANAELARHRAR
ncbi:hypothetical protein JL720_12701 [Aureococcus anophagefferens]|nr:hypothetical protein JL720_12701 [Aureococcus anophagefferens]